ncbi:MotA/TolQ/ExbB proton channel family protein [Limibacter armeniacum]|uniref:MotA/TolQ/ExbB proton channel family protein n=1 Tax=Limibacter armeniacum TaxID=466084 RepID=UPI002FE6A2CD
MISKFIEFLITGGMEFMGTLSLLALINIAITTFKTYQLFFKKVNSDKLFKLHKGLDAIIFIGSSCFFIGILGQMIGLWAAFEAIEAAGGVSMGLLAGGLKVSMHTTLYGSAIFLVSSVAWFVLRSQYKKYEIKATEQMMNKLNSL